MGAQRQYKDCPSMTNGCHKEYTRSHTVSLRLQTKTPYDHDGTTGTGSRPEKTNFLKTHLRIKATPVGGHARDITLPPVYRALGYSTMPYIHHAPDISDINCDTASLYGGPPTGRPIFSEVDATINAAEGLGEAQALAYSCSVRFPLPNSPNI